MLNLNDIAEQSYILAKQRGLSIDVISTLKHCAGEVVEACEAQTRLMQSSDWNTSEKHRVALGLELADIIICALTASARAGISIEDYINEAMKKNAQRAYQEQNNETA